MELQSAPSAAAPSVAWGLPPGWREWTGLLMSDSNADSNAGDTNDSQVPDEEALDLWLLFTNGTDVTSPTAASVGAEASNSGGVVAGPLRIETSYTIMHSYTVSGALDPAKRTIQFTQSCLPSAQSSCTWSSRDFTATVAVAPHDEDASKVKYTMEGTFLSTPSAHKALTKKKTSGSFFLETEASQTEHARMLGTPAAAAAAVGGRKVKAPPIPLVRGVEQTWEEEQKTNATGGGAPFRVSLMFQDGLISSAHPDQGVVSGYVDEDPYPPQFFSFSLALPSGGTISANGTAEMNWGAAAASSAVGHADDSKHVRLHGQRTFVDERKGIKDFLGPFVLRAQPEGSTLGVQAAAASKNGSKSGTPRNKTRNPSFSFAPAAVAAMIAATAAGGAGGSAATTPVASAGGHARMSSLSGAPVRHPSPALAGQSTTASPVVPMRVPITIAAPAPATAVAPAPAPAPVAVATAPAPAPEPATAAPVGAAGSAANAAKAAEAARLLEKAKADLAASSALAAAERKAREDAEAAQKAEQAVRDEQARQKEAQSKQEADTAALKKQAEASAAAAAAATANATAATAVAATTSTVAPLPSLTASPTPKSPPPSSSPSAFASTYGSPSGGRPLRPEEAALAAAQARAAELKAVADAKLAELKAAEARRLRKIQEDKANERKRELELECKKRALLMKAEAARLRNLADASEKQLQRERSERLAQIEETMVQIARARQEEEDAARMAAALEMARKINVQNARAKRKRDKELGLLSSSDKDKDKATEEKDGGADGEDGDENDGASGERSPSHTFHRLTHAELVLEAEIQRIKDSSPVRRSLPPPPLFDYLKNISANGILPHVWDLLSVAQPPPLSVDHPLTDVLAASAASAQPLTPGALLPLTILFSPDALPRATYHTDPSGCIRASAWDALDARAVFRKFEKNVHLHRLALAKANGDKVPPGHAEDDLAATLMVLDGSLPSLALSLLDVGVLLKNGLGALGAWVSPYEQTRQGLALQSFVYPAVVPPPLVQGMTTPPRVPTPHRVVYRAEFSSAHHFTLEKRTNRYALTAPPVDSKAKRRSQASQITPHMRIACFKGPMSERHTVSERLGGRATEPAEHRDVHATLRRLCVALLKRVNDKCRAEDVLVQRLCLYFAVDSYAGTVHLLFGDRMDLRLPHEPAANDDSNDGADAAAAAAAAEQQSATAGEADMSFAAKARRQAEEQAQHTFGSSTSSIGSGNSFSTPAIASRNGRSWQ